MRRERTELKFDMCAAIVTAAGIAVGIGLIWLIFAIAKENITSAVVAAVFIIAMGFIMAGFGSERE